MPLILSNNLTPMQLHHTLTLTLHHHHSLSIFAAPLTLNTTTTAMATHSQPSDASNSLPISPHHLLIVGPGILGRLVAQIWRQVITDFRTILMLVQIYPVNNKLSFLLSLRVI